MLVVYDYKLRERSTVCVCVRERVWRQWKECKNSNPKHCDNRVDVLITRVIIIIILAVVDTVPPKAYTVIEFAGLPDRETSRAEQQHTLDVGTIGHRHRAYRGALVAHSRQEHVEEVFGVGWATPGLWVELYTALSNRTHTGFGP